MAAIQQVVRGTLLRDETRTALWWDSDGPTSAESTPYYLRFALVERGDEALLLPETLLDDWGREVTGLAVYEWIEANGDLFPRAEVFGRTLTDLPRQRFLRELELGFTLPCFVTPQRAAPPTAIIPLDLILLTSDAITRPTRTVPPPAASGPLRRARVHWWLAPNALRASLTLADLSD